MGTYTTQVKRCPHCGKIYERRRVRTPYPDEALVKFERIFLLSAPIAKNPFATVTPTNLL